MNGGAKVLMSGLDYERAVLTGGPARHHAGGDGQRGPYIHDRKQFGQSIGEFQLIQGKVADMYTVLQAGRSLPTLWQNLDMLGLTTCARCAKDCASVILWCAEKPPGWRAKASKSMAAMATSTSTRWAACGAMPSLYEIGAGTSEIRRMLIGRELFAETC